VCVAIAYAHGDGNPNGNRDRNANRNADAYPDAKAFTDAEAATHNSAAETVVRTLFGNLKTGTRELIREFPQH
jgi:hypothetical protein